MEKIDKSLSPPSTPVSRADSDAAIRQAESLSVQSQERRSMDGVNGLFALVPSLMGRSGVHTGLYVPPWWSLARDRELRKFWKRCDHLAGAIYTMEARMTAITKRVVPVDPYVREYQEQAEMMTELLDNSAEYGEGWGAFYGKFVEEILTQDNGVFAEIIGEGAADGPIIGMPVSVAILDSQRCQRTGNPEYPVVYHAESGNKHKLHRTRVMFSSQMPSPDRLMMGVGFCAVSRTINVAQTLVDVLVYKQERLGSRPHQKLLVTRGGLDPRDLAQAFTEAESNMDAQGLTRYSKIVMTGSSTIMDADVREITLNSLPEGFDEYNSTILGISAIALGFGVDARELFPSLGGGATRADAMLAHLKQRGKSPGQLIELTEKLFNQKFLPPHLRLTFDYQDDAQDRQSAEIGKIRQERLNLAVKSGLFSQRTAREQMLNTGDLSRSQFERAEMEDGRLPDGSDILSLLYSPDRRVAKYLQFPGMVVLEAPPETVLPVIEKNRNLALADYANTKSITERWYISVAIYCLDALKNRLKPPAEAPPVQAGEAPDMRTRTVNTEGVIEAGGISEANEENISASYDDRTAV